jgi:hypothetical protein
MRPTSLHRRPSPLAHLPPPPRPLRSGGGTTTGGAMRGERRPRGCLPAASSLSSSRRPPSVPISLRRRPEVHSTTTAAFGGARPCTPHIGSLLAELPSIGGDDGATAGLRSCSSPSTPAPSFSLCYPGVISLLSSLGADQQRRREVGPPRGVALTGKALDLGFAGSERGEAYVLASPAVEKKTPKYAIVCRVP